MSPRQEVDLDIADVERAGRSAFPGFSLRVLARTSSTQDVVLASACTGAAEGFCCVASEQTAGRGRLGRRWTAPPGAALLASILLRPAHATAAGLTIGAGLATADAIAAVCGVQPQLKWPNDVLAGGAKLAGILAESRPQPDGGPATVVLGIGVNLAVQTFPDQVRGTSLHLLVGEPPSWQELLAALLPALAHRRDQVEQGGVAALRDAWCERAAGLGARVRAIGPGGPVEGTAVDLAGDGALIVRTAAGPVPVASGEVVWDDPL